ncbi:dTMP kinase [Fervidobacterium thailandense]|uniref:Thymidylate kinase n=1 Tax=Fervidobacterium thailandense TaxID=1008305 RepID=A0A1E3G3R5_9BACT|nr:dTMP kinase [Fervidobacterium thailandense]ODN30849.1 dTMP kinase [Fervidobacterium thailandense]
MFISFEGLDGCGKSTQIELLAAYFERNGIEYVRVREPGGTSLGEEIRKLLLHKEMCARSELLLFLASRAQLVEEVIKPALSRGVVVIADRFAHSSNAYQGCGRGLGYELVKSLNDFATDRVYPDIVFFLDIPEETVFQRLGVEKDRIERETSEFWRNVRTCYMKMAQEEPERFIVIDGTADVSEIHEKIIGVVRARMRGKKY